MKAPGELAWVALLVEEGHGGNMADAFVAGFSWTVSMLLEYFRIFK